MLAACLLAALQEPPRTDALAAVPEDALVVLRLADPDDLRARAAESAWAELLADPRVAPLVDELLGAFDEALAEEEGAQLDPRVWWKALHGPVCAYLVMDEELEGSGGFLVALDGERAALDELFDELWEGLSADAAASSTSYEAVDIDLLEQAAAEDGGEADVLAAFECAGQLAVVVGSGRERALLAAHGVIDRLSGRDPGEGFAGKSALAEARAAAGHGAAFEMFVDPALATARALDAQESEGTDTERGRLLCERLGLLSSRWLYVAGDVGAGEELDVTFAMHLAGGWLADAAARLGPLPTELLALVPPDSANVALGRVDVAGLWDLVLDAIEELAPEQHAQLRAGLAQAEPMLGFDPETDVLARIRGDFLSFDVLVPPEEVPAAVTGELGEEVREALRRVTVQRYGLEDASDVADAVESVLESTGMGAGVESAEYQGRWVHSIPGALHWCFTDEELFVSQSPTPLRTALARLGATDAPSIAADPRVRAALERHPRAAVLGLGDTRTNLETALSVIRAMGAFPMEDGEEEMGIPPRILALLPAPEVVRDHFEGLTTNALEVGPAHVALRTSSR